ncbi:receptor-like protein 13 [Arachis hypogaea]|uniref:receptor-like protein 13 n=1 Tax=Arachis hypogaea TaxID=3818 RepID=UPI003B20BEC5|nr:putative LRR receptor-like serine/threonine-protein kinase IRK [Arachis hypogaea]
MLLFCLPGWKMIQIAVDRSVSPVIPPRMHHPSRSSLGTNRYADHNINSLNWSLFQTFKEPRTLDLSNNCIHGFIWNGDYRTNSRLNKLEKLDLSNNFFINLSIMEPLSILTSLRNLNLAGNNISGTFPTFLNLKSSVFGSLLVMKSNIDQILFLQDFMSLTALETLDLSHNSVNISIMESLSALTSLKNLFLAENKLVGPLPTKELSLLRNLELLDLGNNALSSPLTTHGVCTCHALSLIAGINICLKLCCNSFTCQGFSEIKEAEDAQLRKQWI